MSCHCQLCQEYCDHEEIEYSSDDKEYVCNTCGKFIDYDPSPCCSGIATSGGDPESCNCDLDIADNN